MSGQPSALSHRALLSCKDRFPHSLRMGGEDSHPNLCSFIFLCLHRQGYAMEERNTVLLSAEFIQAGLPRNNSSFNPTETASHSFPAQSTLYKTWPKKTVLYGRIPVQLQTSLSNCRKKYLKTAPSVHVLENLTRRAEPRETLTMTVRSLCDCGWIGEPVVSCTTS